MDIAELLAFSVKNNASDLHLSSGLPPMIRVDGDIRRLTLPALETAQVQELIYSTMSDQHRRDFEANLEVDFSYSVQGLARFRVNCFHHDRGVGGAFRTIPESVWTLEDIGAPPIFRDIIDAPRGLILMTGPTGSGKSTTLAAMIDHLNNLVEGHVLTIEDPIEFVHESKKSLINQREVHRDTLGFNEALRSALREDPDVILVGELRDLETIRLALTAAETGHLVFGTLHTSSAAKTIDRIVDVFPAAEKEMVRAMLSESLRAVISQTLLALPMWVLFELGLIFAKIFARKEPTDDDVEPEVEPEPPPGSPLSSRPRPLARSSPWRCRFAGASPASASFQHSSARVPAT